MAASKSKAKDTPLLIGKAGKFKPTPQNVYAPKSTTLENHDTTVNVTPNNTQVVTFNVPKFTMLQIFGAFMFAAAGIVIGWVGGASVIQGIGDLVSWMLG